MVELKNMDKFELKQNLKRTNKIIEYAIQQKLGKPYSVRLVVADEDYDNDGLISIMFVLEIEYSDPQWHMEIDEITYELRNQSESIESVISGKNLSIGRNGVFGPYNPNGNILGPSVQTIKYDNDIFNVSWLFEIQVN